MWNREATRWTRTRKWIVLLTAILLFGQSSARLTPPARAVDAPGKPNIVLIVTDDQRWDTLWAMPTVQSELIDHGIEFVNAFASNPLCCPSRASILTGLYSRSNGVYTNAGGSRYGGFTAFDDRSTVATWLQDEGYRTGLFGKYLNGYGATEYVPPGWDRWFSTFDNGGFYDYRAVSDGTAQQFGSDRSDYGTDVLATKTVSFINETEPSTPLFAYFAPHAPHDPATPAPGDGRSFADLPRWRPDSYNERDISDKPGYIRENSRLDAAERREIDRFRRDQYQSLLAVDRAVGDIVQALEDTDRLSNTMIVFMSDNGMSWGEHRWDKKVVPYEESIRLPFVIRFDPAIETPRTDEHLVVNVDLAPTFVRIAGSPVTGFEGRSLVPLFGSDDVAWRTDFLLEHLTKSNGDRGVPTYCGVRTERYKYVRYSTGERELYDLERDPLELINGVRRDRYADVLRSLRSRLKELCRPTPPGYSFRR
jgi:N-acetylglucosamine-6-sulfatase